MRGDAAGEDVSGLPHIFRPRTHSLTFCRAVETVIRAMLRSTKDFEVDGPLQYSRMPELGIISCPMRFS